MPTHARAPRVVAGGAHFGTAWCNPRHRGGGSAALERILDTDPAGASRAVPAVAPARPPLPDRDAMTRAALSLLLTVAALAASPAAVQRPTGRPGMMPAGELKLVPRFDRDGGRRLGSLERRDARDSLSAFAERRRASLLGR